MTKITRSTAVLGAAAALAALAPAGADAAPLTLEECTRLALRSNLSAEQARASLKSAEADVTAARSAFLPRVTASGAWTRPEESIEIFQGGQLRFFDETWSASADASLTLFDGLGNWHGWRGARSAREAAEERWGKARQDVVYETERRFFEVRRSEALLEVQRRAVELSTEQLKKTNAMKDLGAATRADVFKAEVDDANNRLAELRAERDLEVAKASLASYLGLDPREDVELVPAPAPSDAALELEGAIDRALRSNPELAASRASARARRSEVKSAKSDRLPSLSLFGNTNYFNFALEDFDDEHIEWRYGIRANLTIFDGLLTKANIRRAEANLLTASRTVESTERDVIFGVRQAWLDLEIARRSIEVGESAVRSSEEDLRLAQERFRLGEGTILDVIDAQVNLTRSRTDLVTATYDARLAEAALRNAIGELPVPHAGEPRG